MESPIKTPKTTRKRNTEKCEEAGEGGNEAEDSIEITGWVSEYLAGCSRSDADL